MLQRFKQMQPKKKLRLYTIALIILAASLFLLTISSLSITASNLMVTNELSTENELLTLQQEHSSTSLPNSAYLIAQRMIVAFDVLCLLLLPLLLFSVFKFYTKGNLIIIIANALFQGLRWISAVVFEAGDKALKESWGNLFEAAQYGENPQCQL
jgi:hypothetical protein